MAGEPSRVSIRVSPATKAVDPEIQIIINYAPTLNLGLGAPRWDKLLKTCLADMDIADLHWYWAWMPGGRKDHATWGNWVSETGPLRHWWRHVKYRPYSTEIQAFHERTRKMGSQKKLAVLEWNCGPGRQTPLSPCQNAMIQAEMFMQFAIGGAYITTLWPSSHGSSGAHANRSPIDGSTRQPRVGFHVFKLLGVVCGHELVRMDCEPYLPGMAVLKGPPERGRTLRKAWVFVFNKSASVRQLELAIDGWEKGLAYRGELVHEPLPATSATIKPLPTEVRDDRVHAHLPPFSFARLTLTSR